MTNATLPLFPDAPPETPAIGVARSQSPETSTGAVPPQATAPVEYHDATKGLPQKTADAIADGMQRCDENADGRWRHIFDACVLAAARKKSEITSDDVLTEIEALPNPPDTHNLAAIGPAMMRAKQMGVISSTDRVVRSKRPGKHGNRQNVWASNYFIPKKEN